MQKKEEKFFDGVYDRIFNDVPTRQAFQGGDTPPVVGKITQMLQHDENPMEPLEFSEDTGIHPAKRLCIDEPAPATALDDDDDEDDDEEDEDEDEEEEEDEEEDEKEEDEDETSVMVSHRKGNKRPLIGKSQLIKGRKAAIDWLLRELHKTIEDPDVNEIHLVMKPGPFSISSRKVI